MSAKPWTFHIPQDKVERLKRKLDLTDLPDEINGAEWSQGPPLSDIQRLVEAWKTFDYAEFERQMNNLPNFTTSIKVDGFHELEIHFIHEPSQYADAIPLLFVHGWPGSFLEVGKIKQLLEAALPTKPQFHLVALSLPNFGFSSGVKQPGFGLAQYAETCNKLMLSLGYNRYVTQAGDWGYWITRTIGHRYPESCVASHYNMVMAQAPSLTSQPLLALQHAITPYSEQEKSAFERSKWFVAESRGYNYLQSTKPQTLGYSLADSPAGLLSWIYEKLHDWTDSYPWSDKEILTFVSVYWFSTAGPAAAQRIYYEVEHENNPDFSYLATQRYMPKVKLGLAYNPKELENFPKIFGKTLGNVVYEAHNENGGHFYAHEHPDLLVRDLHEMFGEKINAFGKRRH